MNVYDLRSRRQSACSDLRKCPASHYHNCQAYKSGLNCWDIEDVPCCRRNDKARCYTCTLYHANLVGDNSQIYPRTIK